MRGAARKRTGGIDMISSAATSSFTVIVPSSAAIALPTTIFDVLLPAIYAGEVITKDELIRLGDGGLCQLCAACHYPNCTFGRY